jgi:hypothetical protein
MHPFEFALAIVALVLIFKTFKLLMARRETHSRDESVNEDLLARLAQVEERVRVLERIVTDDRSDLKRQFKDLES